MKISFRTTLHSAAFVLLSFLSNTLLANTYYVSASGADTNDGLSTTTPWKTLSRASMAINDGDILLLNRGDTFPGSLIISKSNITVDAYGSGAKPIITGALPVVPNMSNQWTSVPNKANIWQYKFPSNKPTAIRGLYQDDIPLRISRYPDTAHHGYLNYESPVSSTQFIDNDLTGNWSGSDIIIRSKRFTLEKNSVDSQINHTINLVNSATLTKDYGYFFVNNLNAIDSVVKWAYNFSLGTVYVYSTINPASTISYASQSKTIDIESSTGSPSGVTIQNIQIKNANSYGVYVKNSSNVIINQVDISYCWYGVYFTGSSSTGSLTNSTINNMSLTGFYSDKTCGAITVDHNTLNNIGDTAFGQIKGFVGIDCESSNSTVSNNSITNTGYSGIISAGKGNRIIHNVIDHPLLFLEDNGGIYTNGNIADGTNDTKIEENIITNSAGEQLGAPATTSLANGIYIDNSSEGVTIQNNTVAFVAGEGFFIGSVHKDIKLINNTSFQSGLNELQLFHPLAVPGYSISGNILVTNSTDSSHNVVNGVKTDDYTYKQLGLFTNNYIVNAFNDKAISFNYRDVDGKSQTVRYTPYEWEANVAGVNGTTPAIKKYPAGTSPASVIKFYYNVTASSQTYTLPSGLFTTADNRHYCDTVTLAPYKSVVLFKIDNRNCLEPGTCAVPTSLNVSNITKVSADLSWSVPNAINSDVRYRPAGTTTWKYANNVTSSSVKLIGLKNATDYECAVRRSCYGGESSWVSFNSFTTLADTTAAVDTAFKFVSALYENCSPKEAFATDTESNTDNKWSLVDSHGVGTMDNNFMRSYSGEENAPPITMTVDSVLDPCKSYDIYFYYLSPSTQTWNMRAKMEGDASYKFFSRTTPGAELLADENGTSDRLFRAKVGTINGGATGFAVVIDDVNTYGSTSKSIFDGVGYVQVANNNPPAPTALTLTSISGGSVNLQWTDVSGYETYTLERKKVAPGENFVQVATNIPNGTTSYSDSPVSAGSYIYRVKGANGTCESLSSNALSVTVDDSGSLLQYEISGKADNKAILLNLPSNYLNNYTYYIEKSDNPKSRFSAIGPAITKANASQVLYSHTFKDYTPFKGDNYYRLSVVNADGIVYKSSAINVTLSGVPQKSIRIFPNPSSGIFNIDLSDFKITANTLRIINVRGAVVLTRNVQAGTNVIQVNLSNQIEGNYIVELSNSGSGKPFYSKLIKK